MSDHIILKEFISHEIILLSLNQISYDLGIILSILNMSLIYQLSYFKVTFVLSLC